MFRPQRNFQMLTTTTTTTITAAAAARAALGFAIIPLAFLQLACGEGPPPLLECAPHDGLHPICQFQNPEDLVALPGGWLLVSQMAKQDKPGSLLAFHPERDVQHRLWPGGRTGEAQNCAGPPDAGSFAPHGLDLSADGTRLLVVNHGGREAVEFFAVQLSPSAPPELVWSGCAEPPEQLDAFLNDVAALPDGGFVATKMMSANQLRGSLALILGRNSGEVLRWSPGVGWTKMPNSEGVAPNGVATSADGARIFFSEWGARRVVRVNSDGGERKSVALDFSPDNMSWSKGGALLVAGQVASALESTACFSVEQGACGIGSRVVRIEPQSLAVTPVLDHHPAKVAGAVSAALEHQRRIWLGTFAGDRLVWLEP